MLPDELAAGLDAPAAGGLLLELAELPHAAIASTAAASPAALRIFRTLRISSQSKSALPSEITGCADHPFTSAGPFVHLAAGSPGGPRHQQGR